MAKQIKIKQAKILIYGRAAELNKNKSPNVVQQMRYYNYLLMIRHYHKTNPHPHLSKVLKTVPKEVTVLKNNKALPKNTSTFYLMPHWIGEIFTRHKVENEILQHTA